LSAILKALKKIEQESSGEVRDPSISRKLDAKKALNQRARKSWLLRRLSAALGLALVLAAGIVLGFAYGPSFLKGSLPPPSLSDLPMDREQGKMLSAPERPGQGANTRPLISQAPPRAETAQRRMESPPQAHPVLELQAIVWSDDPESCFAVINGHIVRANGMVDGVNVTEISQDAVSLKQGEKVWKIKMLEGD
jgi:hypothetical protein